MLLSGDTIVIDQGTSWAESWLYEEGETVAELEPVDLSTGWVGRFELRSGYGGTVLASFHSEDEADGPVTLGDDGTIVLSLTAEASAAMTWVGQTPIFDIELVHVATGRVVRITEGKATLRPEVTTS